MKEPSLGSIEGFGKKLVEAFRSKNTEFLMAHIPANVVLTDGSDRQAIRRKINGLFHQLSVIEGKLVEIAKSGDLEYSVKIILTLTDVEQKFVDDSIYIFVETQGPKFEIFDICDDFDLKLKNALNVLKSYSDYSNDPLENFPGFSYTAASDTNSRELRERFHLNEVANGGDEVSRIINLMKWVHCNLKYDGNSEDPSPRNTFNIIETCQKQDRGVNCRMHATVLSEVYQSVGLKSRFITCLPEEEKVEECHVITEVFSEELDKWVYMDPSFEAYFVDNQGILLRVEEVRKKLVSGDSIRVNEGININNEPYAGGTSKYIKYMTKNFVRFECLLYNGFESESDGRRSYIRLNPKGHSLASKPVIETSERFTIYNTCNPDVFWQKPE